MNARSYLRAALLASALVTLSSVPSAWAGGGHGGVIFQGHGGWHGGGGMRGLGGGGSRGLPPLSGVIHERAGMRPYFSSYGHTGTAYRVGGFGGAQAGRYGTVGGALAAGGYGTRGGVDYGHSGTEMRSFQRGGLRYADRRPYGYGGPRFEGRRGGIGPGRVGFIYGGGAGYGGDADVGGGYGAAPYAGQGSPVVYVNGYADGAAPPPAFHYATETPLAAQYAERPLAPSPYGGGGDYAYEGPQDIGFGGPHIVRIAPSVRPVCGCTQQGGAMPVVYRYGVGTPY